MATDMKMMMMMMMMIIIMMMMVMRCFSEVVKQQVNKIKLK